MAISLLQSKTVYTGNQIIFDSPNVGGSLLVAFAVYSEVGAEGSIADTNGNTWTNIATVLYEGSGSPVRVDIAYAYNCNAGSNTVNYTPGLTDNGMTAFEYSGVALNGSPTIVDTTTTGVGTTAPTSDVVSGVRANSLVLAVFGSESQSQTAITTDPPFTVRESAPSHAHAVADYIVASDGETIQPSFNLDNSDSNWIIRAIVFEAIAPRFIGIGGKLLVMNNKIITATN